MLHKFMMIFRDGDFGIKRINKSKWFQARGGFPSSLWPNQQISDIVLHEHDMISSPKIFTAQQNWLHLPGDSSCDLFILERWMSLNPGKGHLVNHPKKGYKESPGGGSLCASNIVWWLRTASSPRHFPNDLVDKFIIHSF